MITQSTIKGFVTIAYLTICSIACRQNSNGNKLDVSEIVTEANLHYDTSKTAIIPFDNNDRYLFDSLCKPGILTSREFNIIDSLLMQCVMEYNNSLSPEYKQLGIDLSKYDYKRQLIVVINSKNEKEVWVNYFCDSWKTDWHKEILLVKDGGPCYFNFKVNLTRSIYYDLTVNGEA